MKKKNGCNTEIPAALPYIHFHNPWWQGQALARSSWKPPGQGCPCFTHAERAAQLCLQGGSLLAFSSLPPAPSTTWAHSLSASTGRVSSPTSPITPCQGSSSKAEYLSCLAETPLSDFYFCLQDVEAWDGWWLSPCQELGVPSMCSPNLAGLQGQNC